MTKHLHIHVHTVDNDFREADHPRAANGEFVAEGVAKVAVAKAKKKAAPAVSWTKHGGGTFTEEEHARLRSMRIPPAWTHIKLSADPKAPLQVVGRDAKGRAQYRYSAEHSAAAAAAKFTRLRAFNKVAGPIVQSANSDMFDKSLPQDQRDAAAVIKLVSATGFRIGSDKDTGAEEKAYGASTLTKEHVTLGKDGMISFAFVGKKGVRITKTLQNHEIHRYLKEKMRGEGDRLFDVPAAAVRKYLKSRGGEEFKVKDFRTWNGTNEALKAISGMPVPADRKTFEKQRLEVGKRVAEHLGNTPKIALDAYIDPAVFAKWERNL